LPGKFHHSWPKGVLKRCFCDPVVWGRFSSPEFSWPISPDLTNVQG
jgi:hypothetical protein